MTTLVLITHLVLSQAAASAKVVQVVGRVELVDARGAQPLARFAEIPAGTTVVTYNDGRASLRLPSGTIVRLGGDTRVEVATLTRGDPAAQRKETLKISVGRLWAKVTRLFGDDSSFEVHTDNAVAGVRGTAFFVETTGAQDKFVVDHGAINVKGSGRELLLDGPGANGTLQGGALSSGQTLTVANLEALRADVGGHATNLLLRLDPARDRNVEPFRRTLVGPDDPVDDLLPASRPTDSFGGDASVTVRLVVPNL